MIKMVIIKCSYCGKESEKRLAEINRQKKKGKQQFYCGLSCSGKSETNLRKLSRHRTDFPKNNPHANNRKDKFTPFRYQLGAAKKRAKRYNREFDLDLEYLKELWDFQNGKCAVTGLDLIIKCFFKKQHKIAKSPYQTSLDRIDNSKGYVKGNVRYVCYMFNIARNDFTDQQVLDFCFKVTNGFHQ